VPVDVKQVGRELGVRYVLEGSVRKAGNRIRIHIAVDRCSDRQPTSGPSGTTRAPPTTSFALQDEITERVTAAIEPELIIAAEQVRSQPQARPRVSMLGNA